MTGCQHKELITVLDQACCSTWAGRTLSGCWPRTWRRRRSCAWRRSRRRRSPPLAARSRGASARCSRSSGWRAAAASPIPPFVGGEPPPPPVVDYVERTKLGVDYKESVVLKYLLLIETKSNLPLFTLNRQADAAIFEASVGLWPVPGHHLH
jgi:hypothetical protein